MAVAGEGVAVRRRAVVEGRVQGVFFRHSCRREALAAGVCGWASNLDDGRVEVVMEGGTEAVEQVIAWCHTGPRHAVVTAVQVVEEDVEGLEGFLVR